MHSSYQVATAVLLLLISCCTQAAGWDESYFGQQQPLQMVQPIQPSRKALALYALDRLELLPKPIHRVFVLREDERGSATMSYNINRHKVAIGLRITF